jgi:hypothetical protein
MLPTIALTPQNSRTQEHEDTPGYLAKNIATPIYIELVPTTILFGNSDQGLPAMLPVSHLPPVPSELLLCNQLHHRALKPAQFGLLCVKILSLYRLQLIRARGSEIYKGEVSCICSTHEKDYCNNVTQSDISFQASFTLASDAPATPVMQTYATGARSDRSITLEFFPVKTPLIFERQRICSRVPTCNACSKHYPVKEASEVRNICLLSIEANNLTYIAAESREACHLTASKPQMTSNRARSSQRKKAGEQAFVVVFRRPACA